MKLVIEDEAGTRSVVPFAEDAIVVGRGTADVTFRLTDRNVSRRHARFLRQNGAVFVEDLGSLTGTRVNGERITGKRRLRDGDLVQIGEYDLALLEEGQVLAPGAPPPLPPGARAESGATPQKLATAPPAAPPAAVATSDVAAPAPPPPVPAAPGRALRIVVAVAVAALAAGLAAGWATGALTARTP